MSEMVPGVPVIAVVLADRSPLPLAEVGAPFFPGNLPFTRVVQSFLFDDVYEVHGPCERRLVQRNTITPNAEVLSSVEHKRCHTEIQRTCRYSRACTGSLLRSPIPPV